ncbi:uncharacterized protein LOC125871933 isoform X3 [Solanum stenotomum]|uniref:uncharacterized protein LOC125871933 isoform X3 n=1 Tax=Solanum stenotomum TaxID=172797 RepID=UPI0020D114F8|nr:uncharacterized protein LOC125871933 isoform X3 [Solanum stenotomum]
MVEIPSIDSSATTNIAPLKRYAPPSQRNRSLGRRKSGGGWMAALNAYNNLPYDSSERPVMYTKRSPWGQSMLPHQFSLSVDVTSWRCIFPWVAGLFK